MQIKMVKCFGFILAASLLLGAGCDSSLRGPTDGYKQQDAQIGGDTGEFDYLDAGSDAGPDASQQTDIGGDSDADTGGGGGDGGDCEHPNDCGGCGSLQATPGASCGPCGDGQWACAGLDEVECVGAEAELQPFWIDGDGDGYGCGVGWCSEPMMACQVQEGYVDNNLDCDDSNAAIHPGAVEVCDGVDNNCDGRVDLPPDGYHCQDVCCDDQLYCDSGQCKLLCAGTICGPDEMLCCTGDEICLSDVCILPGRVCRLTEECEVDQICEPSLGMCLPRDLVNVCEAEPPARSFDPGLKWEWTGDAQVMANHKQVMMSPMVSVLIDTNQDGVVNENDIPAVVFNTFSGIDYREDGVLRAVSGADGSRLWPTQAPAYRTLPGSGVAIAEMIADSPGPEIAACRVTGYNVGHLIIVSATGELLREMPHVICSSNASHPAVADINGNGVPEIVVDRHVVTPAGVTVFDHSGDYGGSRIPAFADLNMDGKLELVTGNRAYRHDGETLWHNEDISPTCHVAVADVLGYGRPEVVVVSVNSHSVHLLNGLDGTIIWGPVDVNQDLDTSANGPIGGGPPVVADFNGDGSPEIGIAGGYGYVVLDGVTGEQRWLRPTKDHSSKVTGSSVFDFDGNGRAEVVYNDEEFLRVYDGATGEVLLEECNTNGTLWEYPVIVDVNNNNQAEIVVSANNSWGWRCPDGTLGPTGVRVFGSMTNSWVRTRRIWNQHAYHVTNINEDATVPRNPIRNWEHSRLNNFRQNVLPAGLYDAPDALVSRVQYEPDMCPLTQMEVTVSIGNAGAIGVPREIVCRVEGWVAGQLADVTQFTIRNSILPGVVETTTVTLNIPPALAAMDLDVRVVVNPEREVTECDYDNNTHTELVHCYHLQD